MHVRDQTASTPNEQRSKPLINNGKMHKHVAVYQRNRRDNERQLAHQGKSNDWSFTQGYAKLYIAHGSKAKQSAAAIGMINLGLNEAMNTAIPYNLSSLAMRK